MKQLSVEELFDTAVKQAGVSDFGDTRFKEGVAILVHSINNNENVIKDRIFMMREQLLRMLTNRLWRTKDIAENPEILEQQIVSPTVIISLPRTGSTKLQQVLESMDHFYQAPCWQLFRPARIPGAPDGGRALRFAETEKFYEWRNQASPELHKVRPIYADRADEETEMFYETFQYSGLGMHFGSYEFSKWAFALDIDYLYDYLSTQLKYLHWQFNRVNPKPWLLKSPVFMGDEDQIMRIFPEGFKTIFLHRAPAQIIASSIKVADAHKAVYMDMPPEDQRSREEILGWVSNAIKAHMQWRDNNPSVDILDLSFHEVTSDSVNTCEKICDFTGVEFTEAMRKKIVQWDNDNPRYKRGKSKYSLEDYELTEAQVNKYFSEYLDRFDEFIYP